MCFARSQPARSHGCSFILAALALLSGCAREVERPGQLIVALDTDMALPQQVDAIHVQFAVKGEIEFMHEYSVGLHAKAPLPATMVLYHYGASVDPVSIRVAGSKLVEGALEWRTYREITTPIPEHRIATVRMPIQWLCKGTAQAADDGAQAQSTCEPGYACRAGDCVPDPVASDKLADYAPREIFGGGDTAETGSCFDTVGCMLRGGVVSPDDACEIPRPDVDPRRINVALRVRDDGICDGAGINCFVPLNGDSDEGWRLSEHDDQRLSLPPAACRKMREGSVRAVQLSTACETKTEAIPACGPWANVPKGEAGVYRPAGEVIPSLALVTRLPGPPGSEPCCPLMSDADKLYACVCLNQSATLFEIQPSGDTTPRQVGSFNPAIVPKSPLATTVVDGSLYWAADSQIRRTPLPGSKELATTIEVTGRPYQTGTMLADEHGIYALTNVPSGDSVVRLVQVDRVSASATPIDTGGNRPVFQFDHDVDAIYLAVDRDQELGQGVIERRSSVVRIAKRDGQRALLMPEQTLRTHDLDQGGYLGVQVEQDTAFALFESAAADDRTSQVSVLETARNASPGTEPQPIYQVTTDPDHTRLRLLGTVDGALMIARLDLHEGVVEGSLVLALPKDRGAPRILAEFARDQPLPGLTSNESHVYWLNASGQIYSLPRATLR